MRIAHVISRLTTGAGSAVEALCRELAEHGHEVLLVHGVAPESEPRSDGTGASRPYRAQLVESLGPRPNPPRDLESIVAVRRVLGGFRPDIVHTHTAKAGAVARPAARSLGGRPAIVHTFHGHVLTRYFGRWKSHAYRRIERSLARISDRLVTPSEATAAELVALGVAPRRQIQVIANGFDLLRFVDRSHRAGGMREALGIGAETLLLLYVGRLVRIKRIDVLLRAVADLRQRHAGPIHLAVVGEGELRHELQSLAARLRLSSTVSFTGHRNDMPELVGAADIAVLSSDNEGLPTSLIEAAAGALPVVATSVGGVPEAVAPEGGLLVRAGDPAEMARALARLADDRALRLRMGAVGRDYVFGRFSLARFLDETQRLYRSILSGRDAVWASRW